MSDVPTTEDLIIFKILRESRKPLALAALWKFVKSSAKKHSYNDGFVEWWLVERDVSEALAEWRRREDGPSTDLDTDPARTSPFEPPKWFAPEDEEYPILALALKRGEHRREETE